MIENTDAPMPTLDDWGSAHAEGSGITTAQLDTLAAEYQAAWDKYEEAKAESDRLFKVQEAMENKLIEAMELAGKTKYIVEGQGTYYFTNRLTVPTPKSNAEKTALFNYIKQKHGPDFLMTVTSINHQTLQSFYKSEFEANAEKNPAFKIPGLQEPTNKRSLGFRKEKAK